MLVGRSTVAGDDNRQLKPTDVCFRGIVLKNSPVEA
jgi:hypothetical protein